MVIRVLELFSGIGGLHWALKQTGLSYEIVAAMEINPAVLETYSHNFPKVNIDRRNLESLTAEEINDLRIDAIIMSPPCQPFCRTGHGQGSKDTRSSPLNHILEILPSIKLRYIFIENVQGFETSDTHQVLIETLKECNFKWQEFLINPISLGIPNSRLRYYLIGKHESLEWSFDPNSQEILSQLPPNSSVKGLIDSQKEIWTQRRLLQLDKIPKEYPWCILDILEPFENTKDLILPAAKAIKYWKALDIITPGSVQSCCFTKGYFHYLTGTGSILDFTLPFNYKSDTTTTSDDFVDVEGRKLRYFSPREVARLMCYPEEFQFPPDQTLKQRYKALGNSVNVYVISLILMLMLQNERSY